MDQRSEKTFFDEFDAEALQDAFPTDVFVYDLSALLCTAEPGGNRRCGALVPGTNTMAYYNLDHLMRAGSMYLWPYLCSFLGRRAFFSPSRPSPQTQPRCEC